MENPAVQATQEARKPEAQSPAAANAKPDSAANADSTRESTRELGFQETARRAPREARSASDEGIIFVGKKPLMTYVLAVVTQFNAGASHVKIKARGKVISRVIDVTQVVKNRFVQSMKISNFDAATEMLPNEDGTTSKVSSLTLTLTK
ncbi:MAG: DNA-binding protein Alba [Candidatus Micrarchaeota archaeon]